MWNDIWNLILILGVYQCLHLMHFLVYKKNKTPLVFCLLGLLFIAGVNLINLLEMPFKVIENTNAYFNPLLLFIGPLFYFLVKSTVVSNVRFRYHDICHFIPFMVIVFYSLYRDCRPNFPVMDKSYWLYGSKLILPMPSVGIVVLQYSVYVLFIHLHLRKSKNILDYLSQRALIGVEVIKKSLTGLTIFTILSLIICSWLKCLVYAVEYVIIMPTTGIILFLAYQFYNSFQVNKLESQYMKTKKYKKSELSESQYDKYLNLVFQIMEEEKPYLNNELKLNDLAGIIPISPNILSQVINHKLNKNFYDFINEYRLKEMVEKLEDTEYANYTIFGIAQECGFKNKHTVNKIFKNNLGVSPSEFLKKRLIKN